MIYVFISLLAVVLANLSAAHFGPVSTVVTAFLFIGLDLNSRDKLQELWHGKRLWLKMFSLIATGAVISWAINNEAGQVAFASMIAFGAAGIVNAIVFQALSSKAWLVKVNSANVFAAAVDSVLFPTIAFGGFMPWITVGQFLAKLAGGFLWSVVFKKAKRRPAEFGDFLPE